MNRRPVADATLPPGGIVDLDPAWSRLVVAPRTDGVGRTWHLLDSWQGRDDGRRARLTVLCVHGNPSWSFLWRKLIPAVPDDVRVVAVDQLDMGFSERTGRKRTLATRIDDLVELTTELDLSGPVVTVAHDWGGPISLGWAMRHIGGRQVGPHVAGVVLTNTAVHQPEGSPAPSLIRLVRSRPLLRSSTVTTPVFIRGAIEMSRPGLPPEVRDGFMAPYRHRDRRTAIADFVADIPLDPDHESAGALATIADGLAMLRDVPALLVWGARDLVFSDRYLHDLEQRLPRAQVHRFADAAHFVTEEADVAGTISDWLTTIDPSSDRTRLGAQPEATTPENVGHKPEVRQEERGLAEVVGASGVDPARDAVVEMAPHRRAITFGELGEAIERTAAGMAAHGIAAGDRVALMIPPGIELSIALYACWRRGAVVVLVDAGLGPRGMQRAMRSAAPDHLIGIDKALAAAVTMRWPGRRIAVGSPSPARRRALGAETDLDTLTATGADLAPLADRPAPDDLAAIVFTSGATGPSKGVTYRHRQLIAQRQALTELYGITTDDRLVAAFAPFALYGPTMGITSVVPDMEVTAPATLTADALADAVAAIDATLVFASPAALANVVATAPRPSSADDPFAAVRLLLSAGAPVRSSLLADAAERFPAAEAHTPYGMTEALPVADITLAGIRAAEGADGDGVCVGRPLASVQVMIDPLDRSGTPSGAPSRTPGVLGEIVVRAPHARDGYDRLWRTEHRASQPTGWHRTGDLGRLDHEGRLWVGGRTGHVVVTADGPLAPVGLEQRIEALPAVAAAAIVGVGPVGTQAVVAVVELESDQTGSPAPIDLIDRVRAAARPTAEVAAVLVHPRLPVDRRHNSKIDRAHLARWAADQLAGDGGDGGGGR